jgi:hypothetical protein
MAVKPVNRRIWRKVPLLCVKYFSVKCGLGKMETGTAADHGWPDSWGFRNSKHTASPSYNTPWFELSTGLCAYWVRTYQAEKDALHLTVVYWLSWIQGLTLNTRCHALILAAMQGRSEVTWSPSDLWIWNHLFSRHQGTLTKERNVWWICPE